MKQEPETHPKDAPGQEETSIMPPKRERRDVPLVALIANIRSAVRCRISCEVSCKRARLPWLLSASLTSAWSSRCLALSMAASVLG